VAAHGFFRDFLQPMPSMVVAVPVKYFSMKSLERPMASKICAPQ
jgi:hypothetical protein